MKINKETLTYLANVSAKVFIAFLAIRLLTTFLSKDEVGNYYLILSIIGFINLVILNPIGMYYARTVLEYKKIGKLYESAFLMFLSFILVGFISIPFLFIVYDYLELNKYFNEILFIIYIFLAVVVSTSLRNIISLFNALGRRAVFTRVNILSSVSGLLFSLFFIYIFQKNSISWLYGVILSEIIFLTILFFSYSSIRLNYKNISISLNRLKPIINFMYPIAIITFTIWIQSMSYRIVIDRSFTSADLAIAALGFSIPAMIFSSVENFGSIYFNNRILNNLLDSSKKIREQTWNDISSLMFFFYVLTFVFIICFSHPTIMIVAGENYIDSKKFIVLGAIIEFMRVIINQLNKISHFEKKTKNNILPFILGGVITLMFFIFFQFSRIEDIYYVLILSQVVILILSYFLMNRLIDIRINISILRLIIYSLPFTLGLIPLFNSNNFFVNIILLICYGLYFLLLFNTYFNPDKIENLSKSNL